MHRYLRESDFIIYCMYCGNHYYKGEKFTLREIKQLLRENSIWKNILEQVRVILNS